MSSVCYKTVYLSLGSNLGDKQANIKKALALISERVGEVLALSGINETSPWGYESQETYLNVVIKVETGLTPEALLEATKDIERLIGRGDKTMNGQYSDRVIDIDILLYDDLILDRPNLTIPHPLMHLRAFVLQPLNEIAPEVVHPLFKKTIANIIQNKIVS